MKKKAKKYQIGGNKRLDNVPTPDEFAQLQGLANPKANPATLDFRPNYGMKPTLGGQDPNAFIPFSKLEDTGDLSYHPLFKLFNILAQASTGVANKVGDINTDKRERELNIKSLQNPNFINTNQEGLDKSPIYAKYGIHIKPSHKGRFTAWAKAHGMSVEEAAHHVMSNQDKYDSSVVKMANFAKNAEGFSHEAGGWANDAKFLKDAYKDLTNNKKAGGHWIKGAVNPAHKGYCTPMTKATCTPRRKAFAMTMKKHHGFHQTGGDLAQTDLQKFGNWTGQTDTKVMAEDLKRRGLIGADQLITDSVNTNSADGVRNAQSDWKVAAIQDILSNAKKFNLKTPEEIDANRDSLISNPKWREAINNQSFKTIHPNFWDVINHSILPEQYAKTNNMTAKMQTGGDPDNDVKLEAGEVFDDGDEIKQIPENADTHDDASGGVSVPQEDVERVLENTSTDRKDKASKLLKLQPKTVEALVGFKPKTSLSHADAHKKAITFYNKKSSAIMNKVKKNTDSREENDNDKYALNSLKFNATTLSKLPKEEDMFDALFDHQEKVKSLFNIGDDGKMAKYGMKKYQYGTYPHRNFPQTFATEEDNPYNVPVRDFPAMLRAFINSGSQAESSAGVPLPNTTTPLHNNYKFTTNASSNKDGFNYPLNWYDLASPLAAYLGATKAHINYNPATTHQIQLRGVNPLPEIQQNQSDFNNELQALRSTGVNGGVQISNAVALAAKKYFANNQILGNAENTNAGIKNSETQYNAQAADRQSLEDQQAREIFEKKNLGADEAVRLQKLTALDSATTRIAQNKKFNFEGKLISKLFPNYSPTGDYNGQKYNFRNPLSTGENGIPDINGILENAGIDPASVPAKDRARYAIQIAKKKYYPTKK